MNHNVITVNGLEYKAVEGITKGRSCDECAFIELDCSDDKFACTEGGRDDRASVIFKRHIKLKSK